jgi:hypothetical protein
MYGALDTAPAGSIDEGAYQAYTQGTPDESHQHPGDTSGQTYPAGYGLGYKGQPVYDVPFSSGTPVEGFEPGITGGPLDYTPSSHGGLYPRPAATDISTLNPDALAVVGEQIRGLHCKEEGGSVVMYDAPGGHEEPTDTTTDRYGAPNTNGLQKAVRQLRGILGGIGGPSGGSHLGQADVDQGYGELNSLEEFQGGHSIRIVQHDTMHFDFTGLRSPEEGTWLGKHPVGVNQRFDGPDSPYSVEGDPYGGMRAGAASVLSYPTEYASPPSPTVLPAQFSGPDVFASGGI